jgi:hypothetical protein
MPSHQGGERHFIAVSDVAKQELTIAEVGQVGRTGESTQALYNRVQWMYSHDSASPTVFRFPSYHHAENRIRSATFFAEEYVSEPEASAKAFLRLRFRLGNMQSRFVESSFPHCSPGPRVSR